MKKNKDSDEREARDDHRRSTKPQEVDVDEMFRDPFGKTKSGFGNTGGMGTKGKEQEGKKFDDLLGPSPKKEQN